MTNELFEKVLELDEKINEALERGCEEEADSYLDQQNEIVAEIENLGLRQEFDDFITMGI